MGRDSELGDGGIFGGCLARVSRGEKCASRGLTCIIEIAGRDFGSGGCGEWLGVGGLDF